MLAKDFGTDSAPVSSAVPVGTFIALVDSGLLTVTPFVKAVTGGLVFWSS